MKIILTGTFIALFGALFAQNSVIDLSDILLERRDKIDNNRIYIQEDGSFQLITPEHFYKFDSNGKPLGSPEENKTPEASYKNGLYDPVSGYNRKGDILYDYDGNGHLTFYKLNSSSPNEFTSISFPALESVNSVSGKGSGSLYFLDDENVMMVHGFVARSQNSHKELKTPKGTYSSFIRVVKANLKTKKAEESYHFIDKISSGKFNDIKIEINAAEKNKVSFGVFIGNSIGGEYEPQNKVNGTYQLWELDLDSNEETMITELPVKTTEKTRYCYLFFGNNMVSTFWTEEIPKANSFALFASAMSYKNGEWVEEKINFPEAISIKFPGVPLFVSDYTMKDGKKVHYVQGDFAKTKQDKTIRNRMVILNDAGELLFKDMHTNVEAWVFDYFEGDKHVNYALEYELTKEELDKLGEPLLKKSAMNYLYSDSGVMSRKVGNELMLVHYDWRATNGKPDYMLEVVKLPL
ncbi:MAG: hypothetical protein K0S23_2859 [Fluviicola sp.]|jgi:hypothetical protein|uniref:hypothetical protein n=1 Tax=Fluviicola sp. TaxID=1917219 RepID=UPI0026037A5B|nr:hypothetical protein [Fluviicola sp.]MDF3028552.1 hypothetical protein [Fluviicola sp.]